MTDFTMPSLGADMDEGTLLEWLVGPGDHVHKGDLMAVVDTAKAAVDVESFADGVVGELLVEPGATVAVGTPLARLVEEASTPQAVPSPPVLSPLVRKEAAELDVDLTQVSGTGRGGAITRSDVAHAASKRDLDDGAEALRVTPYARRLARELGVDLGRVVGRGGKPIRAADVRAAGGRPAEPHQAASPTEPISRESSQGRMRTAIADLMTRSKREIPHYYLATTVDLSAALDWMRRVNTELPVSDRLVPAALLLKATALAATETPELNGFWVDGGFRAATGVHIGIATSLRGGGLIVPALHDVDRLSVSAVMAGMRDLVSRARRARLRASELTDATLTVTNLGDQGVDSVLGVIYPPQVALVGFGRVTERPWAVDGLLGVRPVTTLTLAGDHRATDGATGARFLTAIDTHLQKPEEL